MVTSPKQLAPETLYKLKQPVFGNGLHGTPDDHLPVGTEFHAFPYAEEADMVAKMKESGFRGDFYEVFLDGKAMRATYRRYKVLAETLERSV